MNYILSTFIALILTACSVPVSMMPDYDSTSDTSKRGLGFTTYNLGKDYFRLKYTAPAYSAMDSSKNAWEMWNNKATELCNSSDYVVYEKDERIWTDSKPGWLQTVQAKVDCTGNAKQALDEKIAKENEKEFKRIALLANENPCSTSEAVDNIVVDSEMGFDFYKAEHYKEAMTCFLASLNTEGYNADVILHIGMMYEFGKGVPVNIDKAKDWYGKIEY